MKLKPNLETEYAEYVRINSDDPYSSAVVSYTEAWAKLMEERLDKGEKLINIAKDTSYKADTEGITGFMYGCAVKALAHFWTHGEELRQWHNLDCQLGTEGVEANKRGGVLNPAILMIEEP